MFEYYIFRLTVDRLLKTTKPIGVFVYDVQDDDYSEMIASTAEWPAKLDRQFINDAINLNNMLTKAFYNTLIDRKSLLKLKQLSYPYKTTGPFLKNSQYGNVYAVTRELFDGIVLYQK